MEKCAAWPIMNVTDNRERLVMKDPLLLLPPSNQEDAKLNTATVISDLIDISAPTK